MKADWARSYHRAFEVGLVAGYLRGVRRVCPAALVVLTAFIGYQSYRLAHVPSISLLLLTLIDIVVVLLIARAWRFRHSRHDPLAVDASAPH
jgi:uncharacterized membrane protein